MMYTLLKLLSVMPLRQPSCEAFLFRTAMMATVGDITIDDWTYLARLVTYRMSKILKPNDAEKKEMADLFLKMEKDKNELEHKFN